MKGGSNLPPAQKKLGGNPERGPTLAQRQYKQYLTYELSSLRLKPNNNNNAVILMPIYYSIFEHIQHTNLMLLLLTLSIRTDIQRYI